MNICIVGIGKIGSALAERLAGEGHDITVIDSNEKAVETVTNTLDVIGYIGNGATYQVQQEAGVSSAALVIAATASDEVNMLTCLIAHKLGAKYTVARVRNPENHSQLHYLREELGLTYVVNPELATAEEIARILRFPSANRMELFAKGRAELVECRTAPESVLDGKTLIEAAPIIGSDVLVCAVERARKVFIPFGSFELKGGDSLYITGTHSALVRAFKKIDMHADRVSSAMIIGGGRISYYLADILGRSGIQVKLIEQDEAKAAKLASLLEKTRVLVGDAMDHELLMEEGISNADAFVALTGFDECNILSSAYARQNNVRKVITKVNKANLYGLAENLGLDSIVSAKETTADLILGYVRALCASEDSANVELLYSLAGGRVEALEFKAPDSAPYLEKPFAELKLKKDLLIACIIRGRKTIIPRGSDYIKNGDRVIVVTTGQRLTKLGDILEQAR